VLVLSPFHATIEPDWIDYNGHLRDAYYGVIMSLAIDAVMDEVGLDAAYREHTRCTLYTVETHLHYLHEVKGTDALTVATSILDTDAKRIHMGLRFSCPRVSEAVAAGDAMLLHVHQGEPPASAPFPAALALRLRQLLLSPDAAADWAPASRKIAIRRRPAP
jgi:acyl-CoA thioester hydrolase